ncbi:RidA family protein [Roseomonas sp. CCTCC AB2023176]|uniref:RidA family protein n=1 Tax=Roseomonas sp. CCTCC AB2023176 TaxID=3342640 RepID=UPI0035E2CCD3
MREIVHVPPPPTSRAVPPLSYAARIGDLLFVSGLPGYDKEAQLAPDFPTQFGHVIRTLDGVLAHAGADRRRIVKANVYLVREEDVAEMNRLYAEAFGPAPYPARTTVVVRALPSPEMLIEIECVVALA